MGQYNNRQSCSRVDFEVNGTAHFICTAIEISNANVMLKKRIQNNREKKKRRHIQTQQQEHKLEEYKHERKQKHTQICTHNCNHRHAQNRRKSHKWLKSNRNEIQKEESKQRTESCRARASHAVLQVLAWKCFLPVFMPVKQ